MLARLVYTRDQFHKPKFRFQDKDEFTIWIDLLVALASDPTIASYMPTWQRAFRRRACGPHAQQISASLGGTTKLLCAPLPLFLP